MTSDERAIAKVAMELLQANPAIASAGVQFALGDDEKELTLDPGALVISAGFESEEEGSSLPKKYKLTVELRGLKRVAPNEELDDIFARISAALCPSGQNAIYTPTATMVLFQYISFEAQTGGDSSQTEVNSRSRTYAVFALLRGSNMPPVDLSVGRGNAVVPNDALIEPPQAFVDAISIFTNPSVDLDVSGKNITTISNTLLRRWAVAAGANGLFGGNFSNNCLDTATIANIIALWDQSSPDWNAVGGDQTQSLNISGGTNNEPTYQTEFYRFQIPAGSTYANNAVLDIQYDGSDLDVVFKTGTALSGSTVNNDVSNDQWLWIGVSDHPTAAQIVTKIIALWATVVNKNKWTVAVGSASDQLKFTKANLFTSISLTSNSAGFTTLEHQVGNIDATMADIIANGRTVLFNSGGATVTLSL